jgi:hypothetical protein
MLWHVFGKYNVNEVVRLLIPFETPNVRETLSIFIDEA